VGAIDGRGLVNTAVIVLSMWLAGYFAVSEGLMAAGYGFYHVNLLSPINPMGWSLILPTLPAGPGDYEGFIYLGAGGLLLLGVSILVVCARPTLLRAAKPHGLVLLALMGLLIYAITNRIGFAAHDLQAMPLPIAVEQVLNIFRASGGSAGRSFTALYLAAWSSSSDRLAPGAPASCLHAPLCCRSSIQAPDGGE
jgi:hypothetical protein